jgi:hypothetical protein
MELYMDTVQTLIDKGSEKCGGLRRLADAIDENPSYLSNARNGKCKLSPGVAARVADVAGLDARVVALQALVSQEKDHAKAVALARALGVSEPPAPPTRNSVTVQLA